MVELALIEQYGASITLEQVHAISGIKKWLEFFLEGVIEVAEKATNVSKSIIELRERYLAAVMSLSGKQTKSASSLLIGLYKNPIVDIATVISITGLSRPATNALVQRFIELGNCNKLMRPSLMVVSSRMPNT